MRTPVRYVPKCGGISASAGTYAVTTTTANHETYASSAAAESSASGTNSPSSMVRVSEVPVPDDGVKGAYQFMQGPWRGEVFDERWWRLVCQCGHQLRHHSEGICFRCDCMHYVLIPQQLTIYD